MNGMNTAPYQDFAREKLGFEFTNLDLLITALTHRSYVNEHRKSVHHHNERLEFLGDAVLELGGNGIFVYAFFLEPEGILTAWRAALVRTESIGDAGDKLGYGPLIRMSKGEKNGSDRAHLQILANAFEAVIGAIYLERGFDDARDFIHKHIIVKLDGILESGSWRDPKSYLQEISQRVDNQTPVYKVLSEEGPDHDKVFTLGVFVGDNMMGRGIGPSKQVAQQQAARAAIAKYKESGEK
ncbi:ribonuclease III [Candidatus Minimicrobia vallesae]|uniref:Ribonuclease 3 n=1 Tax=Candidatus Minimicrobia vallesae TaxID=2841264 RepID=A0A8F1MAU0_9BACT|nr:ribonuclease III [Candidatus Minimicrobia vallesae]QWQ31203.1 ribonuclease III [Candidatus Minimicrobia vallesae]